MNNTPAGIAVFVSTPQRTHTRIVKREFVTVSKKPAERGFFSNRTPLSLVDPLNILAGIGVYFENVALVDEEWGRHHCTCFEYHLF